MKNNQNSVNKLTKLFKLPKKLGKRYPNTLAKKITLFFNYLPSFLDHHSKQPIVEKSLYKKIPRNTYPLCFYISKSLGTKLIFRETFLSFSDKPSKCLSCVGDEVLVDLTIYIINHIWIGLEGMEINIRTSKTLSNKIHTLKNKKGNLVHAKTFASNYKRKQVGIIVNHIKNLLAERKNKDQMKAIEERLDNWILGIMRLDRKNYKTDKNTISLYETSFKSFYKNRILSE